MRAVWIGMIFAAVLWGERIGRESVQQGGKGAPHARAAGLREARRSGSVEVAATGLSEQGYLDEIEELSEPVGLLVFGTGLFGGAAFCVYLASRGKRNLILDGSEGLA